MSPRRQRGLLFNREDSNKVGITTPVVNTVEIALPIREATIGQKIGRSFLLD